MRTVLLWGMLLCSFAFAQEQQQNRLESPKLRFLLELQPASFLVSPNATHFDLHRGSERGDVAYKLSTMHAMRVGIGFGYPFIDVDLTGGAGYLQNSSFNGAYYQGDLALGLKLKPWLSIGPHGGFIKFDTADWTEAGDLTLNNNAGWLGGLAVTLNGQNSTLQLGFDYLHCQLNASPSDGWTADHEDLDISGFVLNIALLYRF